MSITGSRRTRHPEGTTRAGEIAVPLLSFAATPQGRGTGRAENCDPQLLPARRYPLVAFSTGSGVAIAGGLMASQTTPPTPQITHATTTAESQPKASANNGVKTGAKSPIPLPPVFSTAAANPPFRGSSAGAIVQKIPSHKPNAPIASAKHATTISRSDTET